MIPSSKRGRDSQPDEARASSAPDVGAQGSEQATASLALTVVGIGASAGGLAAIQALLKEMPIDTGMAFVVVLHLNPTHASQLREILSRSTSMDVRTIEHDAPLERNTVYVLAPGANLHLDHGSLQLTPRREAGGLHHPIDMFFRSLAEADSHRAIGVVLSGSANDGMLGLEEIKAAGGITFAQDDSAEHTSMPRSAVAAGCVDLVLPPAAIAREIDRISRDPLVASLHVKADENELLDSVPGVEDPSTRTQRLAEILEHVRRSTGVDFTGYKTSTLYRRIARRMVIHRIPALSEYVELLERNEDEAKALLQDVLISVTSFFRNPEVFEFLKADLFPRLMRERSRREPVRVWVLGCSTGEEAYSIAMAFTEFMEDSGLRTPMQIFATDLNAVGIERARSGIYTTGQVQDVSAERMRRFFGHFEGSFRVTKAIRDMCVFARQNVLSDPPFSRVDLISCRNLLIYLDPILQQRVLPTLHYALKPNGFLWLGSSESLGSQRDLFGVVESKHKIFSKKGGLAYGILSAPPLNASARQVSVAGAKARSPIQTTASFDPHKEADRILLARYAPAAIVVDARFGILQFRGDTSPYLAPAPGRASLDLFKMLREGLLVGVRGALMRAQETQAPVREDGLRVKSAGGLRDVDIHVVPFQSGANPSEPYYIVLFEEPAPNVAARARQSEIELREQVDARSSTVKLPEREIARLDRELASTREYLQSVVEQHEGANEELQAANEEVLSSNEELQSINEEVETSKEEIQASNEELATVNDELQLRIAELSRSNNDMLNLLASVQMPIVMLDPRLCIRRFTPAAETILKLRSADVGRPIGDLRIDFDLPDLEQRVKAVMDADVGHESEVRDTQGRWYLLRIRPYTTVERKADGAVIVFVDVDVLKRGQEVALRQGELLEQTQQPILMWDIDGTITYWNRGAAETYGRSKSEVLGKRSHDVLRRSIPEQELRRALVEHGSWSGELTHERVDGELIVVESRMSVATKSDGSRLVLETNHPITDRRREEAMLERARELTDADRRKNEFLALLAHELRNPLASMRNATQVLRLSVDEHGTRVQAQAQEILEHQTSNMVRMVDDLLDASRMTRGGLKIQKEPLDIVSLLKGLVETTRERFVERPRSVILHAPDEPIYVDADRVRLEQALGNILVNAYKFTEDGGHVWIKAQRGGDSDGSVHARGDDGSWVSITISDDGVGLAQGVIQSIFDMFVQVDDSPARIRDGLGIGLALARTLARMHGGEIEAKSGGLGRGSEFVLRLPALPADFQMKAGKPDFAVEVKSKTARQSILVVDDNVDAGETMSLLLRLSGHDVEVVNGGEAAVELARVKPFDAILLDIGMPGMDGFAVARALRSLSVPCVARLIAVTGYAQEEHIAKARAAGFDHHLTKPVDIEVLLALLAGGDSKRF